LVRRNPNAISKGKSSYRYRIWTDQVLEKCNNECLHCKSKKDLDCHHIKAWKTHLDLRFDVANGIALCKSCHRKEEMKDKGLPGTATRFKKGHRLSEESIEKMKKTKRERSIKRQQRF